MSDVVKAYVGSSKQPVILADLLSPAARVEAPIIKIELAGYTFGVFQDALQSINSNGMSYTSSAKYPNYVLSLQIEKINGLVNLYTLNILYPVTLFDDPNFFEKLLGKILKTREIKITYGDAMLPNYIYRDEQAIITLVTSSIDVRSSVLSYTISATSSVNLLLSGSRNYPAVSGKGSDILKSLIYSADSGITDLLPGLKDRENIFSRNIIASDDAIVKVPAQTGVNVLLRIEKIVDCMTPASSSSNSGIKDSIYVATYKDDVNNEFGGPYLQVSRIEYRTSVLESICTSLIDIGLPTGNVIDSFNYTDDGGWALLYEFLGEARTNDTTTRIDSQGNLYQEYNPLMTGISCLSFSSDKTWWTKVTQFPTQAEIKIKGIIKPAILMSYVKLNVWFYSQKHISSGYYIITKQVDNIDTKGAWTTLSLTRVDSDEG